MRHQAFPHREGLWRVPVKVVELMAKVGMVREFQFAHHRFIVAAQDDHLLGEPGMPW
jgi:hypothetical protein